MTLLTPLTLVTKVVISVDADEDVDELSEPPPPQDANIAADPMDKLNTKPVVVNTLERAILHASLSGAIVLNFIFTPSAFISIR
ncbi:hypothetical protein [Polynucleobacter arcticus]|uniref:hypothetical protein n=1 Tax=Polynucleobacter arcticus TaxID=1743165 RepID=UPI00156F5EF3|nr:hypothetical protein [Polynucleobacter arcticus]